MVAKRIVNLLEMLQKTHWNNINISFAGSSSSRFQRILTIELWKLKILSMRFK